MKLITRKIKFRDPTTGEIKDTLLLSEGNVEEAVDAYLDSHPEKTTTLQDGAVSPAKLNTELFATYKKIGSVLYLFPSLASGGYSGNCSLVVTPTKTILFDCGPTTDWTAIKSYFDQLYSAGIFTNIDYIVISHFHYDHIQNLASILTTYSHNNCHAYIPMNPSGYCSYDASSNRNSVITALTANNVPYTEVSQVTNVTIDSDFVEMKLFNSVAVSKRLGHSSINETLKTYTHLLESTDQNMMQKINEFRVRS